MTPTQEHKAALRAELRARRDAFVLDMAPGDRDRLEQQISAKAVAFLAGGTCVTGYIAIGSEVSCLLILTAAAAMGIATALPHVTTRESPMRFLRWRPGDSLEKGPKNLWQPPADSPEMLPDIILTPMLGFDSQLWRIGQGAGYYDGVFAAMPHARRIGVAWSVQQMSDIPRDAWDQKLDAVVTETIVIEGKDRA